MGWLTRIGGALVGLLGGGGGAGGPSVLSQAVELVGRGVVDENRRADVVADLAKTWMTQQTTPVVDAVIKLMDHFLWYVVIGAWLYSVRSGHPFDIEEVAKLLAGPAAFTLLSGARRGR